jgi:hypothetical protein
LIAGNPVTAYEAGNCPDCVEFNAGGFWEEKVLISGLIQTWSDSKEAQRLMRLFLSSIRKHFKEKINAFWIGPEAYEFLGMAKIGVPVTPTGTPVILHVSEFKARSTAARIILGVLAGSDHIKGTVSVAGTEFEVADSGVTVVTGIGTVARDVGVQTADGIRRLAGVTAK